jgi:hypothetical protein
MTGGTSRRHKDLLAGARGVRRRLHLVERKWARENPVNQSGSVALSAEEVRGPPWRNSLMIMALLTQERYEPGGRGFKSCRARQFSVVYSGHIGNGLYRRHG